jgi:hypothetical protein
MQSVPITSSPKLQPMEGGADCVDASASVPHADTNGIGREELGASEPMPTFTSHEPSHDSSFISTANSNSIVTMDKGSSDKDNVEGEGTEDTPVKVTPTEHKNTNTSHRSRRRSTSLSDSSSSVAENKLVSHAHNILPPTLGASKTTTTATTASSTTSNVPSVSLVAPTSPLPSPSPSPPMQSQPSSVQKMRRVWSMLEATEIEVIHSLQDDMQDILSLDEEEAAPASFLTSSKGKNSNDSKQGDIPADANANKNASKLVTQSESVNPPSSPKRKTGGMIFSLGSLDENNISSHTHDDFLFYDDEDDEEDLDEGGMRNEVGTLTSTNASMDHALDQQNSYTFTSKRPSAMVTRTTTSNSNAKHNIDGLNSSSSSSTSSSLDKKKLSTIQRSDKNKKKFKKNIFKKIGMKKSISMGMFSRLTSNADSAISTSLDVSHHRRSDALSLDLETHDEDKKEYLPDLISDTKALRMDADTDSDEDAKSRKISLDDSSHGRRIDLDAPLHQNTRLHGTFGSASSSSRTSAHISNPTGSKEASASPSPNSIADVGAPSNLALQTPVPLVRRSSTGHDCTNTHNSNSPPTQPSSIFKHCPTKKPAQSILKKATSMLNLPSQSNSSAFVPAPKPPSVSPFEYKSPSASTSSNVTNTNTTKNMKRTTSFSTLEIREYNITIGDNPGGKNGPPISLDWNYSAKNTVKMCIDKYEKTRPPRRARHEMYMSGKIRMWTLLKELGYSLRDIDSASKAADSIRKKRQKSIKYKGIHDLQYKVGKIMRLGGGGGGSAGRSAAHVVA